MVGSICIIAGCVLFYPRSAPPTTSSACAADSDISGSSQVRVIGTGDRRTIEYILELKSAPERVQMQPLIFVGDRQVPNVDPVVLSCGESITRRYTVAGFNDASVVTVFRAPHPRVPDALKAQPSENQARTVSAFPVDNDVFFYATPKPVPKDANRGIRWQHMKSSEGALHLEVGGQQHTFLQLKETGTLSFRIRYGYTPHPVETMHDHVITCLLDDVQVAAFNNRTTWTGRAAKGQVALIEGQVKLTNPGWYVVRCLPLLNVYAKPENVSFSPVTIAPLFVHVDPNKP